MLIKRLTGLVIDEYKCLLGKGPNNVKIFIEENIVMFIVKGTLTPIEISLLQSDENNKAIIRKMRCNLFRAHTDKFLGEFREVLNDSSFELSGCSMDIDFDNDRQVFIVIFNKPVKINEEIANKVG